MRINRYNDFIKVNEEASPRLPKKEKYWLKKGKIGKKVALYTHDDMDGIFSAIEVKKYLIDNGFEIVKYGILNYSDGWKYTTVDPKLINVVVDFANMPGDERDSMIDYYLDHHGVFTEEEKEKYKSSPVGKSSTASAYEAICLNLGVPQDDLTVSVIRMIDAAKYDEYNVDWKRLLDYNLSDMKKDGNVRLQFAAAFNQMLKRGDHQTLISVIHNCYDASIYAIFNTMKKVYPEHNVFPRTGQKKDFLTDADYRLRRMERQTRGSKKQKKVYRSKDEFLTDFQRMSGGVGSEFNIFSDGYALIGDLAFVPTGTWANALRARTIIQEDYEMGIIMNKIKGAIDSGKLDSKDALNASKLKDFLTEDEIYLMSRRVDKDGNVWTIPQLPKFILLQYGGTLQVCAFSNIKQIPDLPKYKDGKVIDDLGVYMTSLLSNFKEHLNYYDPDTSIGQDEITVSGGHGGIGSISNVFGEVKVEKVSENGESVEVSKILLNNEGKRYIDLFKNKIIADLSGIKWDFGLKWSEKGEGSGREPDSDYKVIPTQQITKLDKSGNVIPNDETNEDLQQDFDYNLVGKDGNIVNVTRDEFLKAGAEKNMKATQIDIDSENRKVVAKFDKFNFKG
jgi:hypothetical protein